MEDEQITKMADEIMEMNDFLEKLKKGEVYTHGTKFHADDVFSTVLINKVADKYDIKRPHVNRIIDAKWAGELSNDYIVYDIGFGKFDHHQKDNEIRENGIPYAAFGKLWRAVGADLVGEHAACRIEQSFVQNPLNNAYPERIYLTGDLGKYDENGDLVFTGRIDNQIKYLGHRIELEEVEKAMSQMDGVDRCFCSFEDGKLRGYYVGTVEKTALRSCMKETLPAFMIPGYIRKLDTMPMTKNGKIDRKKAMLEAKGEKQG